MNNKKLPIYDLMVNTESKLLELNYSPATIYGFWRCWKDILSYAKEKKEEYFSLELGERYLLERRGIDVMADESTLGLARWNIRPYKRAVYLLVDFQRFGTIQRKQCMSRKSLSEQFEKLLEAYLLNAKKRYNSEGTVQEKYIKIKQFLLHLEQKNIINVKQITHNDITSFLEITVTWSQRTVASTICYIRQFLAFLYDEKYIYVDLSKGMPTPNHGRGGKLPNIWSSEDINNILSAVDRANPIGKRDYAILLLVTQLGLRDSDVQNLTFDNILWKECKISIIQTKTKHTLELPLTIEIGNAIIDYLKFGRPKQDKSQYVFVRHCAPYGKCNNYYHIMKSYLRRANISFDTAKSHGLHTLRHTLATRLLEQNIPLQTISEILGHTSTSSAKTYLQVDIATLRKCGLNPSEVSNDGRN